MPRWAEELGRETFERIGELLHEGWDVSDIMRSLKLPDSKRRSMFVHARKYGPRRRILAFARFKDALLTQMDWGGDFAKSLTLIAAMAASKDVKPSTQLQAVKLMTKQTEMLGKLIEGDAEEEGRRQRAEDGGRRGNSEEAAKAAVEEMRRIYGLK